VKDGNKKKLWMWQPDLITKLEKVFYDKINKLQICRTPAAPLQNSSSTSAELQQHLEKSS
jgi:hypothetical protein